MAQDARVFSLTVPSEPKMLSVARAFVEAVARRLPLGEAPHSRPGHCDGRGGDEHHSARPPKSADAYLNLQFRIEAETIVLTFQDQGQPFDIAQVPHMNPGELRIGGRGVFLMRALMDEVTCEPRTSGQCGNTLRLVKRCALKLPK